MGTLRATLLSTLFLVFACGSSERPQRSPDIVAPSLEDTPESGEQDVDTAQPPPADANASAQGELMQAMDAIHAKQFDKAKPMLENARKKDPKDARVAYYLGVALENTGDAKAGKEQYRAALELDPALADASVALIRVQLAENDAAGALATAESGFKLSAQNPELALGRAMALAANGKKEEAAKAFGEAVQLRPEDPNYRMHYAEHLVAIGDNKKALEQLRSAASSNDTAALAALSERFARLKAYPDCVSTLDKAIKLKADADLLTRRGQCRRDARDAAGAQADFEAAIKLDEKFSSGHLELGKLLCAKDKKRGLAELDLAVQHAQGEAVEKAKQTRDHCSKGKKL